MPTPVLRRATTAWLTALALGAHVALPASASAQRPARPVVAAARSDLLATLREGQVVRGFRATALYLDAARRPMGARFVHESATSWISY